MVYVPEGIYQHYKGGLYSVIFTAKRTEENSYDVIYMDTKGNVWSRPLTMWLEKVEEVPRFAYCEEQEKYNQLFLKEIAAHIHNRTEVMV